MPADDQFANFVGEWVKYPKPSRNQIAVIPNRLYPEELLKNIYISNLLFTRIIQQQSINIFSQWVEFENEKKSVHHSCMHTFSKNGI